MGTMQKALLKAQDHIFFERGEMKDRMLVVKRQVKNKFLGFGFFNEKFLLLDTSWD